MSYVLDVLEGSTYNPYGFDPNGIRSVMDPLVKSLVVPLINNVLKEIPLPPSLPMPILVDKNAAIGASSPASCVLNVKNDAATITNLPTPANTSYLLGRVYLQGTYISNPGALVVCP
jgi:hypothetical protein